jgi:DNA-binding transcriptional regulator YiaG
VKYVKTGSPSQDHLLRLYSAWRENPASYGEEMLEAVDKIITLQLKRYPNAPIYWRVEEKKDLIAELRLLCFQKLGKITNPTNKRIYNYLRCSIALALKDKTRKVCKQMDREDIENAALMDTPQDFLHPLFLNDELQTKVANLLIQGETRESIRESLKLSRGEFANIIDAIKETLTC